MVSLGGREKNGVKAPTEKLTIFKSHLITLAEKNRELTEMTPEQIDELASYMGRPSKLVN